MKYLMKNIIVGLFIYYVYLNVVIIYNERLINYFFVFLLNNLNKNLKFLSGK